LLKAFFKIFEFDLNFDYFVVLFSAVVVVADVAFVVNVVHKNGAQVQKCALIGDPRICGKFP